ncbi:MAG TPA: hypothetical protein VH639_15745 [Bryobacteraceae bacterium]
MRSISHSFCQFRLYRFDTGDQFGRRSQEALFVAERNSFFYKNIVALRIGTKQQSRCLGRTNGSTKIYLRDDLPEQIPGDDY